MMMPKMLRINRVRKRGRLYQRGLSKQIIKDRRYMLNGRIHKKGTTAISWVIFSVTASRSVEATAGRESQRRQDEHFKGPAEFSFVWDDGEDGVFRKRLIAQTAQVIA